MKRMICSIFALATLVGCGGNNFTITGTLPDMADSIYLKGADEEMSTLAAAAIDAEGNFTLTGKVELPTLAYLTPAGEQPIALLFLEKGEMTIAMNEQGAIVVSGTKANEQLAAYNQAMTELQMAFFTAADQQTQEAIFAQADSLIRTSIEQNVDNLFGAYMVAQSFGQLELAHVQEYLKQFAPELQETEIVARIREVAEQQARTEVGNPYIELNLENTQGEPVALSSLIGPGKWVLVDFWATWCGPCKAEIPHLVEAYKAFHDKGFEIYGVSLDHDPEAWKAYVADHEMTWVNVFGRGSEEANKQVDAYGVQSIPSNFLISPEGTIVATQLRGEAVMETLNAMIQ